MSRDAIKSMPVWLRLGRVSNLPTVVSNVLAAALLGALSGGGAALDGMHLQKLLALMLSMSLLYCAGMYLNDAFDRKIDARERPQRPIPSGEVSASTVFASGYGMLLAGWLLLAYYGNWHSRLYGGLLVAMIVLYNLWHKNNPCSPILMGACRALLVLCVGAAFADGSTPLLWLAAMLMLAHIVGLSHAAKQECLNRIDSVWPIAVLGLGPLVYSLLALAPLRARLPWGGGEPVVLSAALPVLVMTGLMCAALLIAMARAVALLLSRRAPGAVGMAVAQMIAATSLLDGLALAACLPHPALGAISGCAVAYYATRALQNVIPGT